MTIDTLPAIPEHVQEHADTSPQRAGRGWGLTVVVLASLGLAGLALSRDPGVQSVARRVAADDRMRSAAAELRTSIAAAWRENGGTEAMAHAVGRGMKFVKPE